jgi:uncharacterized protein HemX
MNSRRLQGGSLVGYIAVAVVLVLLFAGGLYGLQRYNSSMNEQTADRGQEEQKMEEPEAEKKADQSSEAPAKETPAAAPTNETDETAATDNEAGDTATRTTDETELPTTGPADTFIQLAGAASLAFAATAYLRSRSHHWTKSPR